MTDIVVDGWLWLTDGVDYLKLQCKVIMWDFMLDPVISHYFGGSHFGYDLGKRWLVVKAEEILIKSHIDYSNIVDYLKDWQAAGTITLSVVRNSSNNKIELDGDNTDFTVLIKKPGFKGMEKLSPGDQDKYGIGSITFEQSG